ncbi:MAG: flavodoxin domain-containing protein [Thermomicrobiales bacterium]
MNALVVYDSKFGNTRQIAEAIGGALGDRYDVSLQPVTDQPEVTQAISLLLVGGPTHAHGISQPMRQFLDNLPKDAVSNVAVATFDTRFHKPKLIVGAASDGIAKRLRKRGARIVTEPESFWVESGEGPLSAGEVERARTWARTLASADVPTG